jgi:hypothetical protein
VKKPRQKKFWGTHGKELTYSQSLGEIKKKKGRRRRGREQQELVFCCMCICGRNFGAFEARIAKHKGTRESVGLNLARKKTRNGVFLFCFFSRCVLVAFPRAQSLVYIYWSIDRSRHSNGFSQSSSRSIEVRTLAKSYSMVRWLTKRELGFDSGERKLFIFVLVHADT